MSIRSEEAIATRKLHDRAKTMALRKMIDDDPMKYEIYRHAFLQQLKRESGWKDHRPEANREHKSKQ